MGYYSALKRSDRGRKILSQEPGRVAEVEQKEKRPFRKLTYRGEASTSRCTSPVSIQRSYAARAGGGTAGEPRSVPGRPRAGAREKPVVLEDAPARHELFLPGRWAARAVHTCKTFSQVETKPEMTGHYPGGFSITYKP